MNGGGNILVNNGFVKDGSWSQIGRNEYYYYLEHSNLMSTKKRRIKAWNSILEEWDTLYNMDWEDFQDYLKYDNSIYIIYIYNISFTRAGGNFFLNSPYLD